MLGIAGKIDMHTLLLFRDLLFSNTFDASETDSVAVKFIFQLANIYIGILIYIKVQIF